MPCHTPGKFCGVLLTASDLKAAYQLPNAHVLFTKAPDTNVADNVRSSSFIHTISKGNGLSAWVACEGGAAFRVLAFFTAEEA
jgi:hypothetical protein